MNIRHIPLFPSLVSLIECDDYRLIKNDLISWIYEYQKYDNDGVIISNRGGWQSHDNFYHQPTFINFYNYIFNHIQKSIPYQGEYNLANMWLNINKKGSYNKLHSHPDCHFSGVFWVKTPDNCGEIEFYTPRLFSRSRLLDRTPEQIRDGFRLSKSWSLCPQEGMMLLFPSDLEHEVQPNESNEDRISIAFNCYFK